MVILECPICGPARPIDAQTTICPRCGGPVLVRPPRRKRTIRRSAPTALLRFSEFLPFESFDPALSLGEGGTPLLPLPRLAEKFGLHGLAAKNEMVNPTASFKDRGTVVAVQMAVERRIRRIGTISTGNMAGSTAAYAAKAGLKCLVFVKEDTPYEKIAAAAVFGATVIKVQGDYGDLFRRSFEIGKARGIAFLNSVDPFRIEGYKVESYEIFEQLGPAASAAPVAIFVPVSAGGHILGLMRGFQDLIEAGLVRRMPIFVGVQASGCAPIARAFARGAEIVARFPQPQTIAHAISNPTPPGGTLVLRYLRQTGGFITSVGDAEILRAQTLLASTEGLFCDPASATTLAAARKVVRAGRLPAGTKPVLILTGSGLKTIEEVDISALDIRESPLETLDAAL